MTKCWICETEMVEGICPKCGPPEPWGPTPGELLLEAQRDYEDDWDGDDKYAEDVCQRRHGPL